MPLDLLHGYLRDYERTTTQKWFDLQNYILDYAPIDVSLYMIAIRLVTAEIIFGKGFKRRACE